MINRSEWMHSFISSQSCLLLTKCHALWLSQLQDGSNIQMQPNLFRDEILSFEMMVMLNIVGLNFWTSAVFLWHVFVFLLAKLETLFRFILNPETIHWWHWSLDNHWDEDYGHWLKRLKGRVVPWELLIDDWGMAAGCCCHLACSHCMEEESKNIG